MKHKLSTTKQAQEVKKQSHPKWTDPRSKWADEDCDVCGGEGYYYGVVPDDDITCRCVLINKAEHDGEMAFENDYQERE